MTDPFAGAAAVADAVLYEGYLLYPYRASAGKNRMRFQFGVLVPPGAVGATGEHATARTEVLCEPRAGATLSVRLRFLHQRARTVEVGFRAVDRLGEFTPWEEAVERQVDVSLPMADPLAGEVTVRFDFPATVECEEVPGGRLVRRSEALRGEIRLSATALDGPCGGVRLTAVVANTTDTHGPVASRDEALPGALLGAHTLFALDDGRFLSLTEPPEWAAPATAACVNERTWPVLVGDGRVVLSAPIILYDFPEIAPESPGPLFDGLEIDEILTLRTMTLTDEEKREARATDGRARELFDRIDAMPPDLLDRLHGTIRYLRQVSVPAEEPWWDPAADASIDPDTDVVMVAGVRIAKGSRVRLAPRPCGTDAQDMFLAGLIATVQAVLSDVDGATHVAVTVDDDPAAELQHVQGRFRYFDPTELEPA